MAELGEKPSGAVAKVPGTHAVGSASAGGYKVNYFPVLYYKFLCL